MNVGVTIEIVLYLKKDKRNRKEAHVSEKELDAKKSKKEEARDLHYD